MQISTRSRSLRVGVISLWTLTLFLILFFVLVIGKNQKLFTTKYKLFMFVPNAQGLNPGAFITLSGLKVGIVGEMKFAQREGKQGILVELKIDRKHGSMITSSSIATINTMGMLGDKYVDISLGDLTDPALKEAAFIKTTQPLDIGALASTASAVVGEFQSALKNINRITEDALNGSGVLGLLLNDPAARTNLAQVLIDLNHISNQVGRGRGNLGRLVQDTTLYAALMNTSANLEQISTKIQQGQGSLGKMIADTTLFARLNSVSILADSLLRDLQGGKGSAGKLLKDEKLYDQLRQLTASLNSLTEDIKKNPKKYVTIKVF